MTLRVATQYELQTLTEVANEYRAMWASINPPYACEFDGSLADIDVLDFIGYEGGHHPRDLTGASLIWGNVLVATGVFGWLINDTGDYLIGSIDYPRFLIWPHARVIEIESTSSPQFGKYEWLLQQAVVACLSQAQLSDEDELKLIRLLGPEPNGEFIYFATHAIQQVLKSAD